MKKNLFLILFFLLCISQTYSQYVPNGTLESWDTISLGWIPNEFMSSNMYSSVPIVLKSTDAGSTGFPVPDTYFKSLSGYYQSIPVDSNENGNISVKLYYNGSSMDYQYYNFTRTSGAYTQFEIPFSYTGLTDSVQIIIMTGYMPGSIIYIDSLDLRDTLNLLTSINEKKLNQNLYVYPSPASDFIWVSLPNLLKSDIKFELFNSASIKVREWYRSKNTSLFNVERFDLSGMEDGAYFLKASSGKYQVTTNLIICK
jgi:hypothetical protein